MDLNADMAREEQVLKRRVYGCGLGGLRAAGGFSCDCALCNERPLNADAEQTYGAVSAGLLGAPGL